MRSFEKNLNSLLLDNAPMRFQLVLLFFLFVLPGFAQQPISGVVNDYAVVLTVDTCMGMLVVDEPAFFQPGDAALLIQMQGAVIDESNSSSFGTVSAYGSAGLYERVVIASVQSDSLFVENHLLYDYDVQGRVQLVSLPQYVSAVVSDTLRAQPWNGQTGGVLALEVADTLFLQAPIILDGQGFRGGQLLAQSSSCQWFLNQDDWHYSLNDWRGAAKGEGIARYIAGKEAGRGPQANGGGGGNDHNSGGGGGGNAGAQGGIGGNYYFESIFGCPGVYPGRGGRSLLLEPERIFMGGGGGAGHANNAGAGSGGGAGGGILFLQATVLAANGYALSAAGLSANMAQGDGGGGGGAGGSIALLVAEVMGNPDVLLGGGSGGGSSSEPERCYGPGGGGAGGRFLCNLTGLNPDLSGGAAGENIGNLSQCDGPTNGAMPGQAGQYNNWTGWPQGENPFVYPMLEDALPDTLWACEGEVLVLSVEASGENITLQWQVDTGSGFQDIAAGAAGYSGQQTENLEIFVQAAMQGHRYRCVLSHPCLGSLSSDDVLLFLISSPTASFTYTQDLPAYTAYFTASINNADSLWWDFGDGTGSSAGTEVSHTYSAPGTYVVSLTVFGFCDTVVLEQELFFGLPPQADFTVDFPSGCAPHQVQFDNLSQGTDIDWVWYFPGGMPETSTEAQPTVSYSEPGQYEVILVVQNALGEDSLVQENYIEVVAFPTASFSWIADELEVSFMDASTGDITDYQWDFGDGSPVSTVQNPIHTYAAYGSYEVTLTVSNLHCGSVSQEYLLLMPSSSEAFSAAWRFRLSPNPARGSVVFGVDAPEAGDASLHLYDLRGREWLRNDLVLQAGENRQILLLHHLPKGMYYLTFSTADFLKVWTLVVQ